MRLRSVLTAAWVEVIAGPAFLIVPDLACRLLFATRLDVIGIILTRFVGIGVFSLGIACLPARARTSNRHPVLALSAFNAAAAILFAWVGINTALRGVLLWPAVVLHAGIAAALLPQLLARSEIEA
jgi:hypothetical protein